MKTAILNIGNEVVEGYVLNTNATYFAAKLNEIGIEVNMHLTILDTTDEIIKAVNYLKDDHDLVIVSGGLGPTADDITKESIAKALDIELKINEYELKKLRDYFEQRGFEYNSVNDKQALFSELDHILVNSNGTANGYYFKKDNTTFCILPGPPSENRSMMDEFVMSLVTDNIFEENIYLINIGESNAETKMEHLYEKYPDVYIGCYIQDLGLIYRLKSTNKKQLIDCADELKTIFKDEYLTDQINPLKSFVELLTTNNLTISFAESCTAGLASSQIASIPNASTVLKEAIITYSNEAKIKYLGVSENTLNEYSAVSKECAKEMVYGLRKETNSDICISITGYAGPQQEDEKVGLVYFGVLFNDNYYEFKNVFRGDRNLIRLRAAQAIIFETYKILQCTI